MIGYYNIDNLAIVAVIGKDDNGNGRIDPDEIDHVISECIFPNAENSITMWLVSGKPIIYWLNDEVEPLPGGGYRNKGKNKSEYLYEFNIETGIITVWIYNEDGDLMECDEDGNIVPMDPQPEGNPGDPIPPSWQGNPKDYPGWKKGSQGYPPPPAQAAQVHVLSA